ncbi:hypothetical protein FIV42_22190 [Persicimonas caeni]|uniref:Translocation and assembly module TamB C-terminal domain-containing protein n=1 Tax=Persicimonas caeni TaxID=2292766 RepID=A0A4Y6PZC5_PERCE|nr:translocation/assembly module TamB domain-containing protein [Persicimonas caeni]QDG53357.1 hypothetical protein FIV42_22190 [Persicimonas caeni]QED34578.1 hypothetical protein FRD00_22185 [Persicimonas caeni]
MQLGGLTDEIDVKVLGSHIKIPLIFLVPAAFVVTLYAAVYLYANSGWFLETLTSTLHAQMGGHYRVKELVVDPTLTNVRLYDVEMETPDERPVIAADEIFASINPLVLLSRRLEFDDIDVRGADVRLEFDEEGNFGLMQALGIDLDDQEDEPPEQEGSGLAIDLADVEIVDSRIAFVTPDFRFEIPQIDLPKGSISVEPELLLMNVPSLDLPRIDFVFSREIFGFDEEQGDWTFSVEDGRIRNWRWANDGYNVDKVAFVIEGIDVEAEGQMAFPGGEGPDAPVMTYDATGRMSVPYTSTLAQYFLDDNVHFEMPEFRIAAKGSLNEIDGAAQLYASHVETAGLNFEDVRATLGLANASIDITEASAKVHGGTLEVSQAYFNMFAVRYGGEGRFRGVNPRSLLNDFEVDLPFLDGQMSGAFAVEGGVPLFPEEPKPRDAYALRDFASTKLAHVTVTEDWVLQRNNRELAPADTAVLDRGATTWVDMDRVVIPRARLRLDTDTVLIDDFRFGYEEMVFERGPDGRPIEFSAFLDDVGAWTSHYGLEGVQGPAVARVSVAGPLASPTLTLDVRNRRAPIRLPGASVAADDLRLRVGLDRGRLTIHDANVSTALGNASANGWIDLLLPTPPGSSASDDSDEASVFALRRVQPANLSFSADSVDLSAVAKLAGLGVPVQGTLDASGELTGSLQNPDATLEAAIEQGRVLNQPIPHVRLEGGMRDQKVVVDRFEIDAAGAGMFTASGHYGFDGAYGFELAGRGISFSQVGPLQLLPAAARPQGRARISLHGEGTVDEPNIGGDMQLFEFHVGDRSFGDVAMVVNTVDDTVYLSGAVLPLATLKLEVPLDDKSPFYARIGMEQLDLADAVAELGDSSVVDEAKATGMVELFVEKDFSRYQVLTYLTEFEVRTMGRTIKNRGPLALGLNNGEVFQIQQATIGTGDRYVSLEGAIVLDPLLVDLKVDGQVNLAMLNTLRRALPEVFPSAIVESRGVLGVDASFRGAPDALIADGELSFDNAEVGIRGLSDPIRVGSGKVQLADNRIFVSEKTPLSGSALGGVFNLTGELALEGRKPGRLELSAWSHNMNFRVPETANLTFDTDVKLLARDVFDPSTWLVSGSVDVLDGNFYRDISLFEQEVTGRVIGAFNRRTERYEASIFDQMPELEDIRFDLAVRARDGFEIRNQIDRLGLDLELRIDLRLQDTLAEPYVTGDVDVADGMVSFQGEEFEVRSGTVRFTGEASNPWIDVVAGADIRNRCREDQFAEEFQTDMTLSGDLDDDEEQYYHVILNLQGQADNLDIQFESNPYADQRDILSLLLTGCTVDQLTASSASGPTLEIALGPLLGRIEKEIQDVVKVSEFTIMPGVERTQVRIGDRLTRRLSWNFQLDTGMAETAGGQRSQLEYKLSDRWSAELSGERYEAETNNFLLDLKLKYRLPLD